ncbi:HlyD family secretion protein [Leptospirillum ferrooxidans]|jgi:membrane fusion protein (multidrug efflux system)|uniref:Putative secretion protein n=1 Tax=Leptospirillum ferrooxidans (strain C2-3) TaxID=1162668 RepID=I0IPG0_LEPFC|nr:HlyD family secretion protein [Leptospirillum ferrooxidans]BAM07159.1 putative secretion protein [Leptospirillum ferrooxidans C2-3]
MSEGSDKRSDVTLSPMRSLLSPKKLIPILGIIGTLVVVFLYSRYLDYYVTAEDAMVDGNIILISANTQGRIMSLPYNIGDPVSKGMELARIDITGFHALSGINRMNASDYRNLESSLKDEESLTLREKQAKDDYARGVKLHKNGFITAQDLEALKTRLKDLDVQLYRTKRLVMTDRMALSISESHPLNYTVHSPINGQIVERIGQIGQVVSPGQPILSVSDPNVFWILAKVKETRMGHVRVGQPVDIDIDTYPSRHFHGHVERILPTSAAAISLLPAENASGTFVKVVQRIPVRIQVDDAKSLKLLPGMSAEIKIHIRKGSPW